MIWTRIRKAKLRPMLAAGSCQNRMDRSGWLVLHVCESHLFNAVAFSYILEHIAEHHVIHQYNLVGAKNHYMGLIQTESVRSYGIIWLANIQLTAFPQPYFQPKPAAPTPFSVNPIYHDPKPYEGNASSWALAVSDSHRIIIFGMHRCLLPEYEWCSETTFPGIRCRIV